MWPPKCVYFQSPHIPTACHIFLMEGKKQPQIIQSCNEMKHMVVVFFLSFFVG